LSFINHDFPVNAACNTNSKLNLVSDFIIDSNIFEDVLENNDGTSTNMVDKYDEDVFMVQYTSGAPNQATQGGYQGGQTTPRLYNEMFLNSDSAYDLVAIDVSMIDVERSTVSAGITSGADFDIECDQENSDPNNYYNNTTFLFTPPMTTLYNVDFTIEATSKVNCTGTNFGVAVRDSVSGSSTTGDTAHINTIYQFPNNLDETININLTNVFLENGKTYEFIIIPLYSAGTAFAAGAGTRVEVEGLIYQSENTIQDASKNSTYSLKYDIDQTTWDTIKSDLTKRVDFTIYPSVSFETWIKKIKRTLTTGRCEVLLSNRVT